jgi:lipopolysaccharide biosynthesis regulator YciM
MDLDLQWMLIGLPIAFALGWIASRLDLRQLRRDSRDAPRAYFKGLNLLLNEQPDKAIDAFVDAVRHDPDTTELHFALGNLFRRRGEFERAVRVHEHLLARGDLRAADRERAQRALAEDFAKAGLFDRAETAWRALEGTRFEREARLALLALAERSRDWPRALELAAGLDEAAEGSFATRRAHYECEQVLASDAAGKDADAESALARAHALAPQAARPLLLAGQRHARAGRPAEALAAWDELRAVQPGAFLLVALEYAQAARAAGRIAAACDTLVAEHARRSNCSPHWTAWTPPPEAKTTPRRAQPRAGRGSWNRRRRSRPPSGCSPCRRRSGPPGGTRRCAPPSRGPRARCSATAAQPAVSRRRTTSGSAPAA